MSQQVRVEGEIVIAGEASYTPNVEGLILPKLKVNDYTFDSDADEHDWVSTTGTNGGTLSHGTAEGGSTVMTCAANPLDCLEFYHTTQYGPYRNCGMEARLAVSGIGSICIAIGFVDAAFAGNDHVALELSGATQYDNTTTVHDNCGMTFDTAADNAYWYYSALENDVVRTPVLAGAGTLAPEADAYFRVRVQTDSDGNVWFYYNGKPVGRMKEYIASGSSDLLTPYVGIISRSTDAWVATVPRITVWQDCS